jgi:hypothetical protein
VGANTGEVTLVRAGEALEQQAGYRQAEHGIAEEFEALVVIGAEAAVRQRARQQRRLPEAVADAALEIVD